MQAPQFFQRSELRRALWAFRREFVVAGIFSMVANVLMLSPTLYMLQVFDRVTVSRSELTLLMMSLLTLALFFVMAFAEWMRSRVLVRAGVRLDEMLRNRIFNASFDARLVEGGSAPGRALGDLINLRQFVTGNGIFAFFDTPWAPVYLAVLFFLHPFLGYVAIGFACLQALMVWFGHRQVVQPAEQAAQAQREAQNYLFSKLRNAEVLAPMGMVQNLYPHWAQRHVQALALQGQSQALSHRLTAWSKWLRYVQQSFSLAAGALLVIDGELSAGGMIAANVLMSRALGPIDMLASTWKGFIGARSAFERLESLLRDFPERDAALQRTRPEGTLQLRDVVASASGRSSPILKGITLDVPAGSVTVVLGPSGSGKSTLARCMLGIWPEISGEVLLGGRPIAGWDRDELGQHIGYLPQDVELFEGNIADNIARMGTIEARKVIAAALSSGLHEMILRLPKGYDTPIGVAGNLLSGGQRQRVGLARAVYGSPALVVLDEPNANLDDVGEAALVQTVRQLKASGTTVVLITHRPGIVAVADRLVVMQDGRIQAQGPRDTVVQALQKAQQQAQAQAQAHAQAPQAQPQPAAAAT